MSKLLIDEPPLQVLPSLAVAIGLNEAIIIQQIHYWINLRQGKTVSGERWIYNSYPKWQKQFPFWSVATIQRGFASAEAQGILISTQEDGFNRQKLYRIDYEKLLSIESSIISKCDDAEYQSDTVSPSQNDTMLTETTEITTETTKPISRKRETPARNPELLITTIKHGDELQAQLNTTFESMNRKAPLYFENALQKQAYSECAESLNGRFMEAANDALQRGRISRADLLSTLKTWCKNEKEGKSNKGDNFNQRRTPPTGNEVSDEARADARHLAENGGGVSTLRPDQIPAPF